MQLISFNPNDEQLKLNILECINRIKMEQLMADNNNDQNEQNDDEQQQINTNNDNV